MTTNPPAMAAAEMHGMSSALARASSSREAMRHARRVWHQFAQEWRFQHGLVLLDWLLLAGACWEALREKPENALLPASLPAVVALVIITRSMRADAPRNADAASHTRPLGRAAVWSGKALFFILTLLLPWMLHAMPQFAGYGFGPREWLALSAQVVLPAALVGSMAAGFICLAGTSRQNVLLTLVAFVLAFGLGVALDSEWNDVKRWGAFVGGVFLLGGMLAAWWWQSVRLRSRVAWGCLLGSLALGCALPFVWTWNWRQLPPLRYETTKLSLQVGAAPAGPSQPLWSTLHLQGLPPDHVAAVIALAPVSDEGAKWPPPKIISSDYTVINTDSGKEAAHWRWMTENHAAALVPHYPASSLWHGSSVDRVRGPALAKVLAHTQKTDPKAAEKPWRLRLAVQRMHRVFSLPLRGLLHQPQSITLQTGHRLDLRVGQLDGKENDGETTMTAMLRRRFPLLVPEGTHARIRPMGYLPMQNFIAVLHSPALGEVRVAHEEEAQFNYRHTLLLARHDRQANFDFPHPGPQMRIAGLTLEEWVADSTLDIWWPEERGTIDIQISAADMKRALQPQ